MNENNEIGPIDRIETPLDLDDRLVEQIVLPENSFVAQEGKIIKIQQKLDVLSQIFVR